MRGGPARPSLALLRLGVAAGLLVLLAMRIDLRAAWDALARIDLPTLAAVLALFGLAQALSTVRWRLALSRIAPTVPPFPRLLRFYLIGLFVNLGLPTMVGGDIARAELMRRARVEPGAAYGSILVDRAIGLLAVLALALAAIALFGVPPALRGAPVIPLALAMATALALLAIALAAARRALPRLAPLLAAFAALARRPTLLAASFAIALLVQAGGVVLPIALLAAAMGVELGLATHLALVPLAVLAALVPLTPSGLGVRESAFVLLYGPVGVAPETAFALGFAWSAVLIAYGLLGGLLWLAGRSGGPAAGDTLAAARPRWR